MQSRARIGELLRKMVPLSRHDIEEILQEQTSTRRRFGDIALAWGLVKPEHVWEQIWSILVEAGVLRKRK